MEELVGDATMSADTSGSSETHFRKKGEIVEPEIWEIVFGNFSNPDSEETGPESNVRVVLFGAKGVGKSTLSKWTANKFLRNGETRVLYVNVDPGQPEFNPPGFVSATICDQEIVGKNFNHLSEPLYSAYIGSVNMADCPLIYLNALRCLYKRISEDEDLRNIPWIINTMGFSQGLGVNFACEIIKIFQPTAVIQIEFDNDNRSFPFHLDREEVLRFNNILSKGKENSQIHTSLLPEYQFYKIESACVLSSSKGKIPKDIRDKLFISYFSPLTYMTGEPLLSITPHKLSFESVGIATLDTSLSYDQILRTMNGNLVALFHFPEKIFNLKKIDENGQFTKWRMQSQAQSHIHGEKSCFFGYGIVRNIDLQRGFIYLLTPVSPHLLFDSPQTTTTVNCLIAAGKLGIPTQLFVGPKVNEERELPYILNKYQKRNSNANFHALTKKRKTFKNIVYRVLDKDFN